MTYQVECYSPGNRRIIKKDITEAEYIQVQSALDYITTALAELDQFLMVQKGINLFIDLFPIICRESNDKFVDLNYMYSAWLNAFYSWIEFQEKHNKTVFSKIKQQYYDKYFCYRLSYNLRIVSTHLGCIISGVSYDVIHEKNTICIDYELLIQAASYLQKSFLPEILSRNKEEKYVDVVKIASEMKACK